MPNEIRAQYQASQTLTVTNLQSLGPGLEWQSADVDNSTTQGPQVRVFATIATTSGALANELVEFYIGRADTTGAIRSGGIAAGEGAWAGNKSTVQFVHALPVTGVGAVYKVSFIVDDPGHTWWLIVSNETTGALTTGNVVMYSHITPEVQ